MLRKMIVMLALLFVGVGLTFAQTKSVSGTVLSDEDGLPIIGASVLIKGTTMGTVTDIDGNFTLANVPSTAKTLVISYLGMKSQEVGIQAKVRVVLLPDTELLDEVVVVGYGTAKKVGTVVGALAKVGSEKIESKPAANAMDALQGQVPGLQVLTGSGEPGSTPSVQLRGVGSLTAGNAPLYVLDGAPVSASVMIMMNPNDFESVTVLKDASATSIYGSRAANGVIYITTKKGKMGEKAIVTLSSSFGQSSLARRIGNPMNAQQLLDYQLSHKVIKQDVYDAHMANGFDTNWERYFFKRNAPIRQSNISVQGASEKIRYYVSGSYFNQDGLTPNSGYKRYTFRTNLDATVNDWLKIGANIGASYDKSLSALFTKQGSNNSNGGVLGTLFNQPYFNPYDKNGNKLDYIPSMNRYSPEYLAKVQPSKSNQAQVNSTAYVQLNPIEGLVLRSQFGIEAYDYRFTYKVLPSWEARQDIGMAEERFSRRVQLSITNTAEYKFAINKENNFTVLVGQEGIKNDYDAFRSRTKGQDDDRLLTLGTGTSADFLGANSQSKTAFAFLSYFGRIDYSLKDKYFADFSVRHDRSSRFPSNRRGSTFYSGGLLWDMKQENFLRSVTPITSLKVKGSVGSTGNSSIGDYDYLSLTNTGSYGAQSAWTINNPGNDKLGWETQIVTNLGFDVTFLKKYNLEFTYYRRKTKDMLMDVPKPFTSGFSIYTENVGAMLNSGVEISVNLELFRNKDWYVGFRTNYAYNKNKITKLFSGLDEWPMPNKSLIYRVGSPVEFYMPVFKGVNPDNGKQQWAIPGTNEVTESVGLIGSGALHQSTGKKSYAPHMGGFSLEASYKGLAFTADFAWVAGKYMVNNDRYFSENPFQFRNENQSKAILKEWKEPGDVTSIPKYGEIRQFDTHLLENASFLRLKNIGLAYNLPKSLLDKTHFFRSVKFMINARNILTATAYKGADPELNSNISMGAYPNTKQVTFGAEITF